MHHRKSTLRRLLPAASVAAGAFALVSLAGCQQPTINCMSAHGDFAAVYELKSGDPNSPCGALPGELLGMQTYAQEGGANGTPNYNDAIVAIRPQSLGGLYLRALHPPEMAPPVEMDTDTDTGGDTDTDGGETTGGPEVTQDQWYEVNALGAFSGGKPDGDGFCMAPEFDGGGFDLPALPEVLGVPFVRALYDMWKMAQEMGEDTDIYFGGDPGYPAIAATNIEYKWSDARFLVTADAQGTQFEADLTYTRDGCTAEYHVVGLYPAVPCGTDDDCNDDANGINPDFAVRCAQILDNNDAALDEGNLPPDGGYFDLAGRRDPSDPMRRTGYCVIDGAPPAYE